MDRCNSPHASCTEAKALDEDENAKSVTLCKGAREEVEFWVRELPRRNGQPVVPAAAMVEWRVDASESAVGAFNPNSGARWAKALPEELIGTSSTQRELFGALQVLKEWGAGAAGRSVRLCMDSFAATRNLLKGGGPVPQLCDLTQDI